MGEENTSRESISMHLEDQPSSLFQELKKKGRNVTISLSVSMPASAFPPRSSFINHILFSTELNQASVLEKTLIDDKFCGDKTREIR